MSLNYPPAAAKRSNLPIYFALVLLALLAVVTVIVVVNNDGGTSSQNAAGSSAAAAKSPQAVVKGFMKAAESGDSEAAKEFVDPSLYDSMSDTSGLAEGQTYEVGEAKIDGDSATVPVTTTAASTSVTLTFTLSKSSGDWLITSVGL